MSYWEVWEIEGLKNADATVFKLHEYNPLVFVVLFLTLYMYMCAVETKSKMFSQL